MSCSRHWLLHWLLLFGFALLLPACTPLYAPNAVNAPLLKEQGEVQLGGRVGLGAGIEANIQAAVAVTDHIGVMANAFFCCAENWLPESEAHAYSPTHRFGEVALGYFGSPDQSAFYEVYGGYGRGYGAAYAASWFSEDERVESRFRRTFLQGSAGRALDDQAEIVASLRASYVSLRQLGTAEAQESDRQYGLFLEPVGTLRGGSNTVWYTVQAGVSLPMHDAEWRGFDHSPFFLSAGLRFRLDRFW